MFRVHFSRVSLGMLLYRYMRHCDAVGANTNRVLTTIVYLNKDWITSDGGSLRLYPRTEGHVDIAPLLGRALVFWSDGRVPHEVLPAHQPRYAVSLWYYDTADMQ
jgi:SM-20-related protein